MDRVGSLRATGWRSLSTADDGAGCALSIGSGGDLGGRLSAICPIEPARPTLKDTKAAGSLAALAKTTCGNLANLAGFRLKLFPCVDHIDTLGDKLGLLNEIDLVTLEITADREA